MKIHRKIDSKPLLGRIIKLEIFLFVPIVLFSILGWFYIPFLKAFLKEIISFGLFSSIFFCFTMLAFNSKARKFLMIFSSFFLSLLVFLKISFYYLYDVKLSASALFVIFETNNEEASEFLTSYINGFVVLLLLVLLAYLFFIIRKTVFSNRNFAKPSLVVSLLFIIWIPFSAFIIWYKFDAQNVVLVALSSHKDYQTTKQILKDNLAKPKSKVISVTETLEQPQTYVVVIGESTSKWHMQLYGYPRKTNPKLKEIEEELLVYDDVITTNVHTIMALDKILTLSDHSQPNKKENASVVQLANEAGFSTYWLSNQRPVGINESVSTIIGNAAHKKYFMATDDYDNNIYDEKVLPQLDFILTEKARKKMIFIHLIGTHLDYKKRYPKSFGYFEGDAPNNKFRTPKSEKVINEYDNAVRYNDSIVYEIISRVKKRDELSYVLYFSDHGDELFDTIDLLGHNEYHATAPMYEIPFILWLSTKYKKAFSEKIGFSETLDRKYILEDFIHSFAELSQIRFNLIDATKSIFSKHFKQKPRLIKNGEDYDKRR